MAKRSLFKLVTGGEEDDETKSSAMTMNEEKSEDWMEPEGNLTVDVYQSGDDIVIVSTIAGVTATDLDITITTDMVTIRGERQMHESVNPEDYYYQELYWGPFSRSVVLPQEIDTENAKAQLKDGILTVRLPKLERSRTKKL